jgi:hypothetical protein
MKALHVLVSGLVFCLGARSASAQPEEIHDLPEPEEIHDVSPAEPAGSLAELKARVSPHGSWVDVSPYGEVWKPSSTVVGSDFQPYYSNGRWVNTDAGWSFESEWPWGDVVFHYGRWFRSPDHGWVWVPGVEWGASWCDWRHTDEYVGWAPLPPAGYSASVALHERWVFIPLVHFGRRRFHRHRLPAHRVRAAYLSGRRWNRAVRHSRRPVHGARRYAYAYPHAYHPRRSAPRRFAWHHGYRHHRPAPRSTIHHRRPPRSFIHHRRPTPRHQTHGRSTRRGPRSVHGSRRRRR